MHKANNPAMRSKGRVKNFGHMVPPKRYPRTARSSALSSALISAPWTRMSPAGTKAVYTPSNTLDLLCHPDPFKIGSHRYQGLHSHLGSHSDFKSSSCCRTTRPPTEKFPGLLLIIYPHTNKQDHGHADKIRQAPPPTSSRTKLKNAITRIMDNKPDPFYQFKRGVNTATTGIRGSSLKTDECCNREDCSSSNSYPWILHSASRDPPMRDYPGWTQA